MLTKSQEKLIKSLHKKQGRQETGLCLVEGGKAVEAAKEAVELVFTRIETERFDSLVTTDTPQDVAAIARIPLYRIEDIKSKQIIIVLDGVQDPGNVGSILRLCLGFDASILLVDCADPTSPKCIRSSAGTMFSVPWMESSKEFALNFIKNEKREIYRLEKKEKSKELSNIKTNKNIILVVGSEGSGIRMEINTQSIFVKTDNRLESLNVAHALAIAMYHFSNNYEATNT